MKKHKRVVFSFSVKLRMIIAISILVPSLFAILAINGFTENGVLKRINDDSDLLLGQMGSQLDTVLMDRLQSSVAFLSEEESIVASDYSITRYLEEPISADIEPSLVQQRISRLFMNFAKNNAYINFIFLGLDNGSYMEYPDFRTTKAYDPRVREWYSQTIGTDTIRVSDPYVTQVSTESVISVTKAIHTKDGHEGVVGLTIDLKDIIRFINELKLDYRGQLVILNNRHKVAYNSFDLNPAYQNQELSESIYMQGIESNANTFINLTVGSERYLRKHIETSLYGWHILAFYPEAEILSSVNKVTLLMSIGLVFFLVVILIVTGLMTNTVTEPILDLVRFVENADLDDFQINDRMRKDLYRFDEIGLISRALFSVVFTLRKVLGLKVDVFDIAASELEVESEAQSRLNSGTEKLVLETLEKIKKSATDHDDNLYLLEASKKALELSELRFRMAVQISNDGLWDWRVATQSLYINDRLRELAGLETDADLGTLNDIVKLFEEEDQGSFIEGLESVLQGKISDFEKELKIMSGDSDVCWVLIRVKCLEYADDGKPTWIMGTLIDIQNRKVKEALLSGENLKLGIMVENRTQELLALNEALIVLNTEMAEANANLNQEVKDRSETEIKLSETNQELKLALKTIQDTTEQLIQSEKLSSLGILISGVAHEVNTPLGIAVTLTSFVQQLQLELKLSMTENRLDLDLCREYLEESSDAIHLLSVNIERAAKLIQSFKNISADQYSEEIRSFNVLDYTRDILLSLQPVLKKTSIQVKINCPPEVILLSYPGAYSQIMTNLLMNSVVHGFPERMAGNILVDITPIEQGIKVIYTDDGVGISSDVKTKIFDPFFTTRRGSGSTGLGLYLVHALATQQFHGQIDYIPQEKSGVKFQLKLLETS